MLGTLGRLRFDGWQDYRVPSPKRKKATNDPVGS
jgi:hypothetical protein